MSITNSKMSYEKQGSLLVNSHARQFISARHKAHGAGKCNAIKPFLVPCAAK